MSREIPSSILTAIGQPEVAPYYAVELLLDSGALRVWTGYGDRTVNGNTYTGVGNLLNVSGLDEVNDLSAKEVTISLNAISNEILSIALASPIQNRTVRIYWGVTNSSDAIEIFTGRANTIPFEDSADSAVVSLVVDSKLVILERSSNWRYTQESHNSRYPNDNFFSYVADLQDKSLTWGRKEDTAE